MTTQLAAAQPSHAIGKCLRAMKSNNPGTMLAAVLALKRVLLVNNKTFDDLAIWIESWADYEYELSEGFDVPVEAEEIFIAAQAAENEHQARYPTELELREAELRAAALSDIPKVDQQ